MKTIIGSITNNANYRSLPIIDSRTLEGTLEKGRTVVISGYAGVEITGLAPMWYHIGLEESHFWVHSSLVILESNIEDLPFIDASELDIPDNLSLKPVNQLLTLLSGVSVTIHNIDEIDDNLAAKISNTLEKTGTRLRGTWDADSLSKIMPILNKLFDYGVLLHSAGGRGWQANEIELVHKAVELIAARTRTHFMQFFDMDDVDQRSAFRLMYAPLRMLRDGRDNIHPNQVPDPETGKIPIWWAKNDNSVEIILGTMTFEGNSSKFKPVHLVIHEIAHGINMRYRVGNAFPANVYQSKGTYIIPETDEEVFFNTIDEGYAATIRPRSSDVASEVVTDAITNDTVVNYADSLEGRARESQMMLIMDAVIRYRITQYSAVRDHLSERLQSRVEGVLKLLEQTEKSDLDTFNEMLNTNVPG